MKLIRIATRRSVLARRQSRIVAEALCRSHPLLEVELVEIVTRGDRRGRQRQVDAGAKGLFTAELEAALRSRSVDLAVHSAKDLPARMPEDLRIAAVPAREDARDALICRSGGGLDDLPRGATVGTSSLRRRAQLLRMRGDLKIVPIRGNVQTRLKKLLAARKPSFDAIVLAMAGLIRSGLVRSYAEHIYPLGVGQFVPAAGQGALAVQSLAAPAGGCGGSPGELAAAINDPLAYQALSAERAIVRKLDADCHSCLAVYLAPAAGSWRAWAMAARPDGSKMVRIELAAETADQAAKALLEAMRERGTDRVGGH